MGMDVILCSNLPSNVSTNASSFNRKETSHDLSRTFCNLLCRKDAVGGEIPELDQLGALTHLEIEQLYDMELLVSDQLIDMEEFSEYHSETAIKQAKIDAAQEQAKIAHNIPSVLELLTDLLNVLPSMEPLAHHFAPTNRDTLDRATYFADFTKDVGKGYIGNNFGQDLRNFQHYLLYAQTNGATSVCFSFG